MRPVPDPDPDSRGARPVWHGARFLQTIFAMAEKSTHTKRKGAEPDIGNEAQQENGQNGGKRHKRGRNPTGSPGAGPQSTAGERDGEELERTVQDILSHLALPRNSRRTPADGSQPQAQQSTAKNDPQPSGHEYPKTKREHHQGTLRKLGQLNPNPDLAKKRHPKTLLSGHRIGSTPCSRLEPTYNVPELVLSISRRSSFSVYLKKALKHFTTLKTGKIRILGMGSAVSMALSVALAIQQNLGLGDGCVLNKEVRTGTVVVGDEIHPDSKVSTITCFCSATNIKALTVLRL